MTRAHCTDAIGRALTNGRPRPWQRALLTGPRARISAHAPYALAVDVAEHMMGVGAAEGTLGAGWGRPW